MIGFVFQKDSFEGRSENEFERRATSARDLKTTLAFQ